MAMIKTIKVFTGTDILFTAPSHPYMSVVWAESIIQRIICLPESEFEVKTNSREAVECLYILGTNNGINLEFNINGVKSSYECVLEDFSRANSKLEQIKKAQNYKKIEP